MAAALKRLYGPASPASGGVTIYTVPAVTNTVLRYLRVASLGGGDWTFGMYLGAAAGGNTLWAVQTVPTGAHYEWSGAIPLKPGEILTAMASSVNLVMTVVGVEVT